VGKKFIMAITGMILLAFVVVHLLGNLLVYFGPKAINDYSALLRDHPVLLWSGRVILLVVFGTHVLIAAQLLLLNRAARGGSYISKEPLTSTCGTGTMIATGALVALFVTYHILHLAQGWGHPSFIPGDVYRNLVQGFRNPFVSLVYVAAVIVLGFHLCHGIASMSQSLGRSHPAVDRLAAAIAFLIVAGYVSIPVCVMSEILK
jgi:succinate dehydrogenase / fumarate reductase cytochrome b subunit